MCTSLGRCWLRESPVHHFQRISLASSHPPIPEEYVCIGAEFGEEQTGEAKSAMHLLVRRLSRTLCLTIARSRDCGLADGRVIMNGILGGPTSLPDKQVKYNNTWIDFLERLAASFERGIVPLLFYRANKIVSRARPIT